MPSHQANPSMNPVEPFLIVSIDTECDKSHNWRTASPLTFRGVVDAVPQRLQPLFADFGIRPTYLISPEVMCDRDSVAALRSLRDVELTTHLHGDYIVPQIKTWDFAGSITDEMQWEYGPELERAKLASLTEMFLQQFGHQPKTFRAGRFGASQHTGAILRDLGYILDSSVTPHICWTSRQGVKRPDYRGFPEMPYTLGGEGNIWKPATAGRFLELPVTVLPTGTVAANSPQEPIWFRPWYSDADTLCRVLDHVLQQPAVNGVRRPLVMMFHNVELLAGASPYPQTEAEVQRYLDMMKRVFELAAKRGVRSCTMAEYHAHYFGEEIQSRGSGEVQESIEVSRGGAKPPVVREVDLSPVLKVSPALVDAVLDASGVQPWFKYIFRERANRWDVVQPSRWLAENVAPDTRILSVGAGVGFNLLWLAERGFKSLLGTDIDPKAVTAGAEIATQTGLPVRLTVDDALAPKALEGQVFGVIESLNWCHLIEGFSLDRFLDLYVPHLADEGVIVLDIIDTAFNSVPGNQYHTADREKPEAQRRPSEYKSRFSEAEVRGAFERHGLVMVARMAEAQQIPKVVYIGRKSMISAGNVVAQSQGVTWLLDPSQEIDRCLRDQGCFEPETTAALKELVAPGMTIVDVGANIGAHALPFAVRVGASGKVHAFEPMWPAYRKLLANAALNALPNLALHKMVVGNKNDVMTASFTNTWRVDGVDVPAKPETVAVRRLDDLLPELGVTRVDLIKIDVDGFEFQALKGAEKLLRQQHPILVLELGIYTLERVGDSARDMLAFLEDCGYAFWIDSDLSKRIESREELLARIPAGYHTINIVCRPMRRRRVRPAGAKPRIMLMADVPNWIFARHCRVLTERLSDDFQFELKLQGQAYDESQYDLLYPLEFNLIPREQIRTPAKYVTGIRSHLSWSALDFLPFADLLATRFQRVHAVSKRLQGMFKPFVPNIRHVTHGVDTEFFRASTRADRSGLGKLRIGWAGNRINATKGFEQLIAPLARIPGVELVFCGYQDKNLNVQQMKEFYDSIDCYVCSSSIHHEGNNNSLMEAASMERAIVTTDNGAVPEYLRHRENALIIERELPNFIHAVCELRDCPELRTKLGRQARQAVVKHFDWKAMAEEYREMFWEALEGAKTWKPDVAAVSRAVQPGRYASGADAKTEAQPPAPPKIISASVLDIRKNNPEPDPLLEAELSARAALKVDPNGIQALRLLASALFAREKWLECAQICYRLLGLQPNDADVMVVLAESLLREGDASTAVTVLSKVMELQPDNLEVREMVAKLTQPEASPEDQGLTPSQEGEILAGMKALEADDLVGALKHYEEATRLGPANAELNTIISQIRDAVAATATPPSDAVPRNGAPKPLEVGSTDGVGHNREPGWSFCIITNGKRPAKLAREIESIRALNLPAFEILVGGAPPEGLPADVGQVPAIDAAQNGRLGEMRNKLTTQARFDHLVVVDDDFIFHDDFMRGIESCGEDWDILCPRILNPDGTRYWDWATQGGPRGHVLLEYGEADNNIYVTGGLCVMKAWVSDRVKWDDVRGFYQGEDLDFSARLRAAGVRMRSNPASTTTHDDGHYTREKQGIKRRDIAELGLPIRWLAPFFNPSGYASEAINFVLPVSQRSALGLYHDNSLTSEKFVAGLPEAERAVLFKARDLFSQIQCGVVVTHNPANGFRKLANGEYHIGRTMFETDTIPKGWAENCNRMDEVWVPSKFNVETFARAGVSRDKLIIMPGAVDAEFFNPAHHAPLALPNRARYNFLSIFEWSSRKGWDAMLAAYLQEFSQEDDVCLYLRTYLFSKPEGDPREALNRRIQAYVRTLNLGNKPLPRIEILAEQVPNSQLPALYLACDCYLAPSRGEGWGRPQHEAMLMERPVIATNWSANTEFMTADNSYLLDYELVEAKGLEPELWHYKGQRWANPSVKHLRELMRRAEQNPAEARQKGLAARVHMATHFSREAVGEKVIRRLQAIERQFSSAVLPSALVRSLHSGPAPSTTKVRTVAWEGSFLDYGSLSCVNRELVQALGLGNAVRVSPVGANALVNGHASDPELQRFAKTVVRKPSNNPEITVRHSWPPVWDKPKQGKWVMMQPWEFGALPRDWVSHFEEVDQVWAYTSYVQRMYLEAGMSPSKVKLVPLGIDPKRFHPGVAPLPLATAKKYKFLFVGGTIQRKGSDVLLKTYLSTFRRSDDVCLVIKDFGGSSVYAGQTLEAEIRAAQADVDAPEILYLNQELKAEQLPALYTACDCLVHPYRGEGFGLPVLEAMASGLAVIVTGGGSTDDFATDEYAYRIPAQRQFFGDSVGGIKLCARGWWLEPSSLHLGLAMAEAHRNPVRARELGQKASEYVRREWTWEKTAKTAANWLHELAAQTDAEAEANRQLASGLVPNFRLPEVALVGSLNTSRERLSGGDVRGAWESANESIRIRPFHPEGYLMLAEIAVKAGDYPLARRCASKAQSLAPRWKEAGKMLSRIPGHAGSVTVPLTPPAKLNDTVLKLTVCLIAKNEERFLAQCLRSIQGLADQIVMVDTGSIDSTREIAKSFGAEVYELPWADDFSAPRNEALKHATGDWILVLDADEELPADQHALLREAMREKGVIAARLPIVDIGREDEGCSYVPRLFCNAPGLCYVGRIHEQVFASVETRREQWSLENKFGRATIRHYGYRPEIVKDRDKVARNLRLLELAVEEYPNDINLLMNLGLELMRAGQAQAGIEAYEKALAAMLARPPKQTPPELKESLFTQFATHFVGQKLFAEAINILTLAEAREGDLTASMHFLKGLAYLETKQFPKAAEQMRACLAKRDRPALTPIHAEIKKAGPAHCLAMSLRQMNQPVEAVRYYRQALKDAPKSSLVRLEFAEFEAQRGEFVSALTSLHEAVGLDPSDERVWRLGGDIALRQPATKEFALDWTGEALKYAPNSGELRKLRAESLLLGGQPAEAAEIWRELALNGNATAQAAAILSEVAGDRLVSFGRSGNEEEVSRECIKWYRKLIQFQAEATVLKIHSRLGQLAAVLPSAGALIERVSSAALTS
ncbi:MAG TPA: FkbM family methyltransferase [Candidatus Limnocylindria bacterium]|nr:FkbM family methyltransferase [Candidatus Limnocylindria bacterium]